MTLEPIVVMIGTVPIEHGERGHDLDASSPEACLCGVDTYWKCDGWLFGDGIANVRITKNDDGAITFSSPRDN